MHRSSKEERYLRDTLTILQDNVPKKRRRIEIVGDEDGVGHELVQEKRKSRLNEILPILISGPLASNGTFVNDHEVRKEGDDDSTGDGDDGGGGEKPKRAAHDQMACYKLQLEQLKQENEEFNSKATATFRDYAKLVSTYEFGLKHISDLKDLSSAPDNILDGNFTSTY